MDPLLIFAVAAAVLAVAFLITAIATARRKWFVGTTVGATLALLLLTVAALLATIAVGTQGYRAFTREVLAATVIVEPSGPRQFDAHVTFADGRRTSFALRGDQVYIDAHILKWKPIANLLGLHTAFELDRIGGRYLELEHERDSARTIFSLSQERRIDMFTLRRRWSWLAPLLDTEYGSGTFVTADRPDSLEVRVSTSGLLIRRTSQPIE
jgi:hypothetical protein